MRCKFAGLGIQLYDTVTDFGSVPNCMIAANRQPVGRGTLGNWVFRDPSGARGFSSISGGR